MNEEVLSALSKAKWNEFVRVDIEDSSTTSVILVPRLDRQNGGIRWEDARHHHHHHQQQQQHSGGAFGDSESTTEATAHVRTKKWIFPMLHDKRRNQLYEQAIEKASREVVRRFLPDAIKDGPTTNLSLSYVLHTLDIGSGTGLLALLSQKHLTGALSAQRDSSIDGVAPPIDHGVEVTSLEMAGPMAKLAKQTVELERRKQQKTAALQSTISVIEGHSCKIPSMKKTADAAAAAAAAGLTNDSDQDGGARLCTSELLESGLLGEGWLPAMRDAWERHLHPRAVVLPQSARVVAMLVQGVASFCGPHESLELVEKSENDSTTRTNSLLRLSTTSKQDYALGMLSDGSYDPFSGDKHGIQVEIHADRYLEKDDGVSMIKVLSEPIVALSIDVTSPEAIPSPAGSSPCSIPFVASESGRAEGVLFWWELDLYGDGLTYSTKPGSSFQDHWHQCLYVFPPTNTTPERGYFELRKGTEYTLCASHTDSRVHFSLSGDTAATINDDNDCSRETKRQKPIIPPQVPPVAGPRRCWQLNDLGRSAKLRDGIKHALDALAIAKPVYTNIRVLDVSDFSLCGMMASLLSGESNSFVTSVESSASGLPLAAARVAQIGNGLPNDGFQIVQCHAESLTHEIVLGSSCDSTEENESGVVDLVVGEPYYEMLEGWPVETALNYFYTIRMLKRKGIVRPKALSVPAHAVVLACGIECPDLGRGYRKQLSSFSGSETIPRGTNSAADTAFHHVCGFDHTPLVECWKYDEHGISIPLWEYKDVVPVTEIVEVGKLDYECDIVREGNWVEMGDKNDNDSHQSSLVLSAPFTKENRTCHAVAFWVEYGIRTSSSSFETLSTGFGSPSERQTVRILAHEQSAILGKTLAIPRHGLEL